MKQQPTAILLGFLSAVMIGFCMQEAFPASVCEPVSVTVSGSEKQTHPADDATPNPQTDLTIDFDILDQDGNELYAGKDPLGPMQVDLRTQATAKNADAGKWKTRDDADTISVNWYVRYQYQDGSWTDWDQIGDHGNLSIGKLDKGDTIQETRSYQIQTGDFIRAEFKSKIDTDDFDFLLSEGYIFLSLKRDFILILYAQNSKIIS